MTACAGIGWVDVLMTPPTPQHAASDSARMPETKNRGQ
jgi:hypothetical protein